VRIAETAIFCDQPLMAQEAIDISRAHPDELEHITGANQALCEAIIRLEQQDYASGVEVLERAIERGFDRRGEARLAITVVKIAAFHATNRYEEAQVLYREAIAEEEFETKSMAPYLLRNAEMAFEPKTALTHVQRAVKIFQSREAETAIARARITQSFLEATLGYLGQATETFDLARPTLDLGASARHIILNHQAALLLLKMHSLDRAMHLLREAKRTAKTAYHRLVILNNITICAARIGDQDAGDAAVSELGDMYEARHPPDVDTWRSVSVNLSRYCLLLGRVDDADRYWERVTDSPLNEQNPWNPYWESLWSGSLLGAKSFEFILSQKFHPLFLRYWNVDILLKT
jgi:hypothetical protein